MFPAVGLAESDYERTGLYAGLGVIGALYTDAEVSPSQTLKDIGIRGDKDYDPTVGLDIRFGYRMYSHLSAELNIQWLSESDIEVKGDKKSHDIQVVTAVASLKAYMRTEELQPYVRFGMGVMYADVNENGGLKRDSETTTLAAAFGGGLEYYVMDNILVYTEVGVVLPTKYVRDLDQVTFGGGVQYRF